LSTSLKNSKTTPSGEEKEERDRREDSHGLVWPDGGEGGQRDYADAVGLSVRKGGVMGGGKSRATKTGHKKEEDRIRLIRSLTLASTRTVSAREKKRNEKGNADQKGGLVGRGKTDFDARRIRTEKKNNGTYKETGRQKT